MRDVMENAADAGAEMAVPLQVDARAADNWDEAHSGLTLACGTAACAVGVAAARDDKTGRNTTIHLPGGPIGIEWRESDGHVLMTGLTEVEFEGEVDLETLTWRKTAGGDAVPWKLGPRHDHRRRNLWLPAQFVRVGGDEA
jgi:hypothetical protein